MSTYVVRAIAVSSRPPSSLNARRPKLIFFLKSNAPWFKVQVDQEDPEQHDLWSNYLPSRIGLVRLREFTRQLQAQR